MKRLDLSTIVIMISIVLVVALSVYLFLQFSNNQSLNITSITKGSPTATRETLITNPDPIYNSYGIVTKIEGIKYSVFDIDRQLSLDFIVDADTEILMNKQIPPYILGNAVEVLVTTSDLIRIGDLVSITVPVDIAKKPSTPPVVKKLLISQQLSLYTEGTVTEISVPNNSFTLHRKDNYIESTGIIVSVKDIKKFTFGYTDEPERNHRPITIDKLHLGDTVLIYSDTPIAPDAKEINAAYIKATQPTRPEHADLILTPTL